MQKIMMVYLAVFVLALSLMFRIARAADDNTVIADTLFIHCLDAGFSKCEDEHYDVNFTECGSMIVDQCKAAVDKYIVSMKSQ